MCWILSSLMVSWHIWLLSWDTTPKANWLEGWPWFRDQLLKGELADLQDCRLLWQASGIRCMLLCIFCGSSCSLEDLFWGTASERHAHVPGCANGCITLRLPLTFRIHPSHYWVKNDHPISSVHILKAQHHILCGEEHNSFWPHP